MCMEDIKIGRSLNSVATQTTLPVNTLTTIAPADPRRVALLVGVSGNTSVRFGPAQLTIDASNGYNLSTSRSTQLLRIEDIGNVITQEWRAFSTIATVATVIDSSLHARTQAQLR